MTTYTDTGCKLHPSCLNCPEDVCVEDLLGVADGRALKHKRNRDILEEWKAGKNLKELVEIFGLNQRSIERILRDELSDNGTH